MEFFYIVALVVGWHVDPNFSYEGYPGPARIYNAVVYGCKY